MNESPPVLVLRDDIFGDRLGFSSRSIDLDIFRLLASSDSSKHGLPLSFKLLLFILPIIIVQRILRIEPLVNFLTPVPELLRPSRPEFFVFIRAEGDGAEKLGDVFATKVVELLASGVVFGIVVLVESGHPFGDGQALGCSSQLSYSTMRILNYSLLSRAPPQSVSSSPRSPFLGRFQAQDSLHPAASDYRCRRGRRCWRQKVSDPSG
jgi:hypothetical protein